MVPVSIQAGFPVVKLPIHSHRMLLLSLSLSSIVLSVVLIPTIQAQHSSEM